MAKQADIASKRAERGSRTGRPVMALLDLLSRRWTLQIVWELRDGPLTSLPCAPPAAMPRRR
ncbi:DNA-binding HxlR family transcriptional regulator [Bradyrhizobium sp. AZCC 1610]